MSRQGDADHTDGEVADDAGAVRRPDTGADPVAGDRVDRPVRRPFRPPPPRPPLRPTSPFLGVAPLVGPSVDEPGPPGIEAFGAGVTRPRAVPEAAAPSSDDSATADPVLTAEVPPAAGAAPDRESTAEPGPASAAPASVEATSAASTSAGATAAVSTAAVSTAAAGPGSTAPAAAAPGTAGSGTAGPSVPRTTPVPPPDGARSLPPPTGPHPTLPGVPAVGPRMTPRLTAAVLVGSLLAAAGAAAGAVALVSEQSDGAGWPGATDPTAVTRPDGVTAGLPGGRDPWSPCPGPPPVTGRMTGSPRRSGTGPTRIPTARPARTRPRARTSGGPVPRHSSRHRARHSARHRARHRAAAAHRRRPPLRRFRADRRRVAGWHRLSRLRAGPVRRLRARPPGGRPRGHPAPHPAARARPDPARLAPARDSPPAPEPHRPPRPRREPGPRRARDPEQGRDPARAPGTGPRT